MDTVATGTLQSLNETFVGMKAAFSKAPAPSYQERVAVLKALKASLLQHEQAIYEAINKDYGYRSEFDTLLSDLFPSISAINYTLKRLKKWMRPSKRHAGLILAPSTVTVRYQPLGVVGVITPWNFPLFLALGPTVQALAAGNRVMIKMSEFTPHTNQALCNALAPLQDHVAIIEGEADVGAAFSKLPFDHLIFTGSTAVAKRVAAAAAENLTPLTLELGGKSPTIIDDAIDINIAVDAVMFGKSINSGQICVAPDYLFIPAHREQEFITAFITRFTEYYLENSNQNTQSHIVSERQYLRLLALLEDANAKGAEVHAVKAVDADQARLVYPHLLTNLSQDMRILHEEVFGPVLPIMPYTNVDEVIRYINDRPRPLALYVMSNDKALINRFINETHSGGVGVNDTVMHAAADDAPFGGIGHSGMGHYHGHEGFLTFSKAKTVLRSSGRFSKARMILKYRDFVFKTTQKYLLK